jgi:hypothetical protein
VNLATVPPGEWELQQQGFDYCSDKKLYDRMEHGLPKMCVCTSLRILLTGREWSGSSGTLTSPGLLPLFHPERGALQQ